MSSEDTARQVAAMREELRELVDRGRLVVEGEQPQRLRMADVTRALLAAVTKTSPAHSSVTLTQGARGQTQIEVSVRVGDSEQVQTVDEACAKAVEVYDRLRLLYPHSQEPARRAVAASKGSAGDG